MQFLTQRKDVSFFSFFYKFMPVDQAQVINDLKNNVKSVALIQRPGSIEAEALFEDNTLAVLKKYMSKNYRLVKTTEIFYIYNE